MKLREKITTPKLTRFTLFSQRLILHRLSTPHDHRASMNCVLHHHRFLRIELSFGSETFKETFAGINTSRMFQQQVSRFFKSHSFIDIDVLESSNKTRDGNRTELEPNEPN